MATLPTGTVTFVFTDIENSTGLLTSLGDAYASVLERHQSLLRHAFERNDGVEVMTEGDSFFVVFRNPSAAVRAAADAQHALQSQSWPEGGAVRVRMGLHTGEAVLGGDTYVGLDVHRASRIAAAGHGGQVLLSDATRALVEQSLPDRAALRDLGRHRLKGLPHPEHVFQLTLEGLASHFPTLNSLEARPNNLPSPLTSFVGREQQIEEIRQRLATTRLLTLTGPGGTGKTRLSVRVAEEALGDYEHGCWFVPLEALRDPELVASTIVDVLRVKVPPDQDALAALGAWLAERQVLLVLDNFEQVTAAAPHVATLLAGAPRLRILVTSRTALQVYGEKEYAVPPLASAGELRDAGRIGAERLSQYEAVQLFIERALAVKPNFRVTNANAPAVAEICARLDGLPLAIELAAARIKLLTPEQIQARLEQSLSLLATTAPNLPERQRTLRGAIDWSYELLSEPDRRLFARLSVFRGGWTLEAAEKVVGGDGLDGDVLDGLSSLVNKSLVRADEQATETRFAMLETIRGYARERLAEAGEGESLNRRHAHFFFDLAEQAEDQLMGSEQLAWLERLRREHDNLRAAFERMPEHGLLDRALTAAGTIWRFWQLRAYFLEARSIFDRLLGQPGASGGARAKALTGAGGIAYWQGDYDAMEGYYREARELYESVADRARLAEALYNESFGPVVRGDIAAAEAPLERAIALYHETGNVVGATEAEIFLGVTRHIGGAPEEGLPLVENAVATYRSAGALWYLADALIGLGYMQAAVGRWSDSRSSLREGMDRFREMGNELGMSMALQATAAAAAWIGEAERAARLLGKAEAMKEELGGGAPAQMFDTRRFRDKARAELGEENFRRLLAEGASLTLEQAAELAEGFDPPPDAPPIPPPTPVTAAKAGE